MDLSPELKTFIHDHLQEDTDRLLLTASRYPGIDIPFAIRQILCRRQIREKLPSWFACEDLIYPSRLSAEQCSSEPTARYKQKLLKGESFCDLTGGLGVDSHFFAQSAPHALYIERFPDYCEAARHNFAALGTPHIRVLQADVRTIIGELAADTFYVDPARRNPDNKRTFALADCEPDILQIKDHLLTASRRLIVKISPMADLEQTLRLLPETNEIHIVAVKNECKELLFVLEPEARQEEGEARIYAINLRPGLPPQEFSFQLREEKDSPLAPTGNIGGYLYEPHAALLKSGAFKLTAHRYGLQKLHRHSHLYTSSAYVAGFPGRSFAVDEVHEYAGKQLKQLGRQFAHANITARNFPQSVADIRKRTGIKEGGDIYFFATTLANEQKVLIRTHKVPSAL